MIEQLRWLGHGSFVIDGPPQIYINPWRVTRNERKADIILISSDQYDHFSTADIEKLRGPETKIIGSERIAREIEGCIVLRPWQSLSIDRVCIKAVPAYSPNGYRHPASEGGLGFVISMNFYDLYYAGDTQAIPDMACIHPDVAILPIDGNGTLTVAEAAEVTKQMRPKWVIPCNWGTIGAGATRLDAQRFVSEVENVAEVLLLERSVN